MSWDAIPSELRSLRQWLLWRYEWPNGPDEKPTKVPYQLNGKHANVNDPSSWCSFDECVSRLALDNHYSGLGFVFTKSDPYSGVDLDDPNGDSVKIARHQKVYDTFVSYAEKSVSGTGVHIIVKGSVPTGVRQHGIEVYSSQRFFVFTGDVIRNEPIREHQDALLELWSALDGERKAGNENANINAVERDSDEQIIEQCRNADNGAKFTKLYAGEWNNDYPSQSEADFALVDIIAFYTKNRDQISRIFRASKLGVRPKAKRNDYLVGMINKSFDQTVPLIDISQFKEAFIAKAGSSNGKTTPFEGENVGSIPTPATTLDILPPPGLTGEIAQFIYQSAPYPVKEIAIAGAIGLMAAICGRAYNVSNSGLNQYLLLLAETGVGKESIASGIDALIHHLVKAGMITAKGFVGPSHMASGPALSVYLTDSLTKTFVSMIDEFGLKLEVMSGPKASEAQTTYRTALIEIFGKSKKDGTFKPTYYSDKAKNAGDIISPSVSILGYSTPGPFYDGLTEEMLRVGLIPRFSIIEYKGFTPPLNRYHENVKPSFELITKLAELGNYALARCIDNHITKKPWEPVQVQFTDDADRMRYEFEEFCRNERNNSVSDIYKYLWSRCYLKALKLAALFAVGDHFYSPTISVQHLSYAIEMVCKDVRSLAHKFETGEVGGNDDEDEQIKILEKASHEFVMASWEKIKAYVLDEDMVLHHEQMIPATYFNRKFRRHKAFKHDKIGATNAINKTLKTLCDHGTLQEIKIKNSQKKVYKLG